MNILTIDMDYIADQYLSSDFGRLLEEKVFGVITEVFWSKVHEMTGIPETEMQESVDNLREIFQIFIRYIQDDSVKVVFGLEHDSILNHIPNQANNINIINLDHHHDITYNRPKSDISIAKYGEIGEGDWVYAISSRVSSYIWVSNKTSETLRHITPEELGFQMYSQYYSLNDVPTYLMPEKVDLIYVCLSPTYFHRKYWHYFWMLKDIYESITNNTLELDTTRPRDINQIKDYTNWRHYGSNK